MRRTGRTLRSGKEFRSKCRDTRTWGSSIPGRGWRGGFTASSCMVLAGLERCSFIPAAALEPGDLLCGWDPARKLCSFGLSEMNPISAVALKAFLWARSAVAQKPDLLVPMLTFEVDGRVISRSAAATRALPSHRIWPLCRLSTDYLQTLYSLSSVGFTVAVPPVATVRVRS